MRLLFLSTVCLLILFANVVQAKANMLVKNTASISFTPANVNISKHCHSSSTGQTQHHKNTLTLIVGNNYRQQIKRVSIGSSVPYDSTCDSNYCTYCYHPTVALNYYGHGHMRSIILSQSYKSEGSHSLLTPSHNKLYRPPKS